LKTPVRLLGLAAAVVLFVACRPSASDPYQQEIAQARATRQTELTKADGWLTLIGLHFLQDGANTVGSAKDNAVVLTKGPAHFGVATVADGKVTFALADGVKAQIDGQDVRRAALRESAPPVKPSLVTSGTVTFYVVERGGKKALRVKDSAAESRTHFLGIDYFPVDPAWRIEARWEQFEKSRLMPVTNILGQTAPEPVPGQAVFERDGKTWALLAIDEGPDEPLFFVISDATTGKETYGACRFIYAPRPKDGKIVLDFNLAENPPCAFTPFATCPLPPKENRLPFAVTAGEKNYRGAPH
jgi:uncharacterized protein